MDLKKQNILFFSKTMNFGGTSNVIIQLCEILKSKVGKIVICSYGGSLVYKLADMGIKHYVINNVGIKSLRNAVAIIKQVDRIVREENITIIHTHHRMAGLYTEILKKFRHRNIIYINTAHNTFYDKKILTRISYKDAYTIACGEMVRKNLIEYYSIPDSRVSVIHNAVKAFNGKIEVIEVLKCLKEDGFFLVGNVGRFTKQKGMEYFIKSLPLVKKEIPKIKYVMIGDGADKEKLLCEIESLELENDVIFLGYRRDIQNVIAQIDLLVLSSLWEGLPLTPIEAFSVGKTVVASAVDGVVEIVNNEVNGLLVKPKNSAEIAQKVVQLIKNPDMRKMLEKNSYITFLNEFSFDEYAKKIEDYYRTICMK